MRLVYLAMFGLPLLFSGALLAHEGDDHKGITPLVMPDQMVVHEATTDTVELVFKHPMFEPGKTTSSRVFLSTADENKPIANADVEFEFADLDDLKIKFVPEKDHPGVYTTNMTLPKSGSFDATVSVSGKDISDLLTLSGIEVKPAPLTVGTSSWILYTYLGAALALLFLVALVVVIMIRRRKHA